MKNLYLDKMPPPTDTNGVCIALKDYDILVIAIDAPGTMATLRHLIDPSTAKAHFATMPCVETEYISGDPKFFINAIVQLVNENPAQMTVIVNGPVGMLIGIDLANIASEVEIQTKIPTRYVETTGNGSYEKGLSWGKNIAEEFSLLTKNTITQNSLMQNPFVQKTQMQDSQTKTQQSDQTNIQKRNQAKTQQKNCPRSQQQEEESIDDLEPYQLASMSKSFPLTHANVLASQNIRQIAFYGKGGIGKSTVAQNVTGALAAQMKRKIMLVGCDPKADSTRLLTHDAMRDTVLDILQSNNDSLPKASESSKNHRFTNANPKYEDLVKSGFAGICCVEAGGPEPGVGCAGRGILAAFDALDLAHAYTDDLDYVFYDVLGDVVCGGFAAPIRSGRAKEIYLVVSGELMSLYAANNICKGIARYSAGGARLAGIICNSRNVKGERELAEAFANAVSSILIGTIARDDIVQQAEINRKTVIEYAPSCKQSKLYLQLAHDIENNTHRCVPTPLSAEQLESLMQIYGL